jgi:hypothetical protein
MRRARLRPLGSKARRVIVVALIAILFAPVLVDRDSFPLSTYPMYARNRSETVSLVTARGVTAEGDAVRLSLGTIGASDDPLIVAGELRAAVRRDEADDRCRSIAARVEPDAAVDVVSIEVVTERHDTVTSLDGGDSLIDEVVHARCPVVT